MGKETDLTEVLNKLDHSYFWNACRREALRKLPNYLASICNEESKGLAADRETWFISDACEAVFKMMDWQAQHAADRLAETEVTLKVFDALNYALTENCPVQIEGDSRFGKTEAVQAWCAMRPGVARLVKVPCSNCDGDLYAAIADALGITYKLSRSNSALKSKVEFVLRYSRIFLCLDEAHFLIQQRFSKDTPPMRLNWVRTEIMDKRLPVALISTPQSFRHGVEKFVRATGYNIDQFLGRTMFRAVMPNELEREDLIAVAKIHFPDVDEESLGLIAAKAFQAESYLKAVEAIAKRARYIARRDGHPVMTMEDLRQAMNEIMPSAPAQLEAQAAAAQERRNAPTRKGVADRLQGQCKTASEDTLSPRLVEPRIGRKQGDLMSVANS